MADCHANAHEINCLVRDDLQFNYVTKRKGEWTFPGSLLADAVVKSISYSQRMLPLFFIKEGGDGAFCTSNPLNFANDKLIRAKNQEQTMGKNFETKVERFRSRQFPINQSIRSPSCI